MKTKSAWKMFKCLMDQTDSVKFACELCEKLGINIWEIVEEQEAIKIMQDIKKELQSEYKHNWICGGCRRECKTFTNDVIPNYFCSVASQKTNWQPIKKEHEKDKK